MDELNEITKKLISFETTKNKQKEIDACLKYIKNYFSGSEFIIREFKKNGKKSIVISYLPVKKFKFLMNGHIDVVDADKTQFTPVEEEGKICGRGAVDMKAGVAGMMFLMKELANKKPDMGLMIVTDEEIGGFDGTNYLINEEDFKADFAIASEPNKSQNPEKLDITYAHKGVLWLKISQKGKPAHASVPWKGENAIENLMEDFLRIKGLFAKTTVNDRWKTTVNLSKITGGKTTNSVPEKANMTLDIRFTEETDTKKLIKKIKEVISGKMKVLEEGSMLYTNPKNEFVKTLQKCVKDTTGKPCKLIKFHGSSDMRFTSAAGIPSAIMGPYGEDYHGEKEFVYTSSLEMYYNALKLFVETSVLKKKK